MPFGIIDGEARRLNMMPMQHGGTEIKSNSSRGPTTTRAKTETPSAEGSDLPPVLRGAETIRAELSTLPHSPGVYRMIDRKGAVLYVGKAKDLSRRVAAYTRTERLPTRLQRMVAATTQLEIITTRSEVEALLLEANLIKRLKPYYNVVLRDDKSFPSIVITGDHPWPQIAKHRGARARPGQYFGPFASAGAVNRTLSVLQRAFPLRSCSDAEFATRTRPCLQYQIKRCTAPCVGRITAKAYAEIVAEARDFLSGASSAVQKRLSEQMLAASHAFDFEAAAIFRDRIQALSQIQAHQDINVTELGEADVIALCARGGLSCVQVFFYRAGQNCGNRAYFPAHSRDIDDAEVLAAFIGQFYDTRPAPAQILVSHRLADADLLAEALSIGAGRKVQIHLPERGRKKALVANALENARVALERRVAENASQAQILAAVGMLCRCPRAPRRIEVYDNSHIQGEAPVGAMIVAGAEGFRKNAYRKFNLRDTASKTGDDYAMLREMLTRRFARLARARAGIDGRSADEVIIGGESLGEENANPDDAAGSGEWPDLLLIDGGQGQLSVARATLEAFGLGEIPVAGIAKGEERNAGRERFFVPDAEPFSLPLNDPVLYYLQRLRDEAHRFAIGAHRKRRSMTLKISRLDEVAGIGPRRKKALLLHFGSARAVAEASLADLEKVAGVSKSVAQVIYNHFHG